MRDISLSFKQSIYSTLTLMLQLAVQNNLLPPAKLFTFEYLRGLNVFHCTLCAKYRFQQYSSDAKIFLIDWKFTMRHIHTLQTLSTFSHYSSKITTNHNFFNYRLSAELPLDPHYTRFCWDIELWDEEGRTAAAAAAATHTFLFPHSTPFANGISRLCVRRCKWLSFVMDGSWFRGDASV